ncbi:hypothetical protein GcM3_020029 [Golovinomyces cichoracearum]|uniref:Uncharacterized protein n=1 Tax=Golovinomyces cichoracearum TaxID=62708 RepID=A0A420J7S4_9PEZI|nr:hypothetical protein GcM3_020029 [Golovinomyces cichoracearum]
MADEHKGCIESNLYLMKDVGTDWIAFEAQDSSNEILPSVSLARIPY